MRIGQLESAELPGRLRSDGNQLTSRGMRSMNFTEVLSTYPVQSIASFDEERAGKLRYILTDIDDTITYRGKMIPEALQALWDAHEAGLKIIPVTGGSAGWADTFLRRWPVDGIITESGALAYWFEDGVKKTFIHPSLEDIDDYHQRLEALKDQILTDVPAAKVSTDQDFRLYDLAIDYHDETPYLSQDDVEAVLACCEKHAAHTGVSSIHINCWFGDFDKLSMVKEFLNLRYALSEREMKDQVFYCGDAVNDSPLFGFFPASGAVENIIPVLDHLSSLPSYITRGVGGKGFSAIVKTILEKRKITVKSR